MNRTSGIYVFSAIATSLGSMRTQATRKSRAGLAVAAVLGASVLTPSASFGYAVDVNVAGGALVSASGGDTLLFPIYTTAAGQVNGVATTATTSFSVTNTSSGPWVNVAGAHGGQTIAAKIRFREQDHSMDVLDFIVVLSPTDKFDFTVRAGNPRPVMSWNDNSCVIGPIQPAPGTTGSVMAPSPFTPFVTTNEQMSVGHLEVLGMADLSQVCVNPTSGTWVSNLAQSPGGCVTPSVSLAAAATHVNGVPPNCALLQNVFGKAANVQSINANGGWTDVDNVLVGRYAITIPNQGIEGGSDAIAIQNSDLTSAAPGAVPTLVTSQSPELCTATAPANCTSNYAWDTKNWDHPHLADMLNLANFQAALTTAAITGDWSNNPLNNVGVDWVLSFPDKYAYLNYNVAGCGSAWCLLTATGSGNGTPGLWVAANTPAGSDGSGLCLRNNAIQAYDRDEDASSGVLMVSPGSQTQFDVCPELTVFTLATSTQTPIPSVIQTAPRRQVVTFQNLDAIRGWASLPLSWNVPGDSVTGILWTVRATEDPTQNNGSITELQKF